MTYTYKLSRRLASSHDAGSDARRIALLLLLLLAISCGGDDLASPTTPQPGPSPAVAGWLSVMLTTPNADDGAIQLSLSGAPIDSLELSGNPGFAALVDGAGRLLVTGNIRSGVVARIWVPDLRAAARYHGSVDAAAARSSYALQDLSRGYAVQVTR